MDEGTGTYVGTRSAKRPVVETDGLEGQMVASSGHTDMPSIENDANNPAMNQRTSEHLKRR